MNVDRHCFASTERAYAANEISRKLLSRCHVTWTHPFDANDTSELLCRNVQVTVHEDQEPLVRIRFHHQSFYDVVFGNLKIGGCVFRPTVFHEGIKMWFERNPSLFQ